MGFSFNQFFGLEHVLNAQPDLVVIYGFATIVFGLLLLSFLALIFNKMHFNAINEHFIAPLMWILSLTFVVAVVPTIVLYFLASDITGVKLIYCWIAILVGNAFFCCTNFAMIKKWINKPRA